MNRISDNAIYFKLIGSYLLGWLVLPIIYIIFALSDNEPSPPFGYGSISIWAFFPFIFIFLFYEIFVVVLVQSTILYYCQKLQIKHLSEFLRVSYYTSGMLFNIFVILFFLHPQIIFYIGYFINHCSLLLLILIWTGLAFLCSLIVKCLITIFWVKLIKK